MKLNFLKSVDCESPFVENIVPKTHLMDADAGLQNCGQVVITLPFNNRIKYCLANYFSHPIR